MEITLWVILYLAFVLPVTKCISLGTGGTLKPADCLGFGLIWPVAVVGILGGELIYQAVKLISKKIVYLIED